jgi:site-specific DNA-cytosine methylase
MTFVPDLAHTPVSSGGNDKHDPSRMTYVADNIAHSLSSEGADASEDGTGRGTPLVAWALQERDAKGPDSDTKEGHLIVHNPYRTFAKDGTVDSGYATRPVVDALHTATGGGNKARLVTAPVIVGGGSWPTLGADSPSLTTRRGDQTAIHTAVMQSVRRLTPTECERLQGFPDGWTEGQADSVRYRQLGNAVAVPVVEWIARRIVTTQTGGTPMHPKQPTGGPLGIDRHLNTSLAELDGVTCLWDVTCENPATHTQWNPRIGDVPICDDCQSKLDRQVEA